MALGVRDKPKNAQPQSPLGVRHDPNAEPANLMGAKKPASPSVPEFSGPSVPPVPTTPPPGVGPQLPPQQNGPIFPQDAAQPIAFNGGFYNPTTAPFGMDMSQPGQREQFWDNNQGMWFQSPQLDWVDSQLGQFSDPWQSETFNTGMLDTMGDPGAGQTYWNGVRGDFNSMGSGLGSGYTGPNNSQTAFDMTKGMLPGSLQPQFDAYYDRMKQKAMSDVNSQSAARGAYGSNAALNNSIGAGIDVEAQRAKAATDFMLADSQNQASWQGLLGNQGRNADLTGLQTFDSKLKGSQFGLDKMRLGGDLAFRSEEMDFAKDKALSDLAFGIDDQRMDRISTGAEMGLASDAAHRGRLGDAFSAAGETQDARERRIQGLYGAVEGMSTDVQNFFMSNYDALLSGDQQAFEQSIDAMLAQYADQRGWSDTQQAEMKQDLMDAADTYMSIMGMPGGVTGASKK